MGQEFNENYEKSVTKAYRELLKDLSKHMSLLVDGGVMTAKEVLDKIEDLQKHLKSGGDEGKKTQIEVMNDWLNGREIAV